MQKTLNSWLEAISGQMYGSWLIILLLGGGIWFFIATRALPVRLAGEAIRVVAEPPSEKDSMSSFRALMVSTASRVGVGNIAGAASAVALGGAGAVFWMWVVAVVGSSSAFIESTLAQIYKRRNPESDASYGGPAYYIEAALKQRWLGIVFAIALIATYFGGFNMVASFTVASSFENYSFHSSSTPLVVGAVLAILVIGSIMGGPQKLSSVTAVLVPAMAIVYIVMCLAVIVTHIGALPGAIGQIFSEAFTFSAAGGGLLGAAVMNGIKRGLYSNEAGVGSAPNAAASASVSHPVKQGLVQMLSVWIDTLLICSATAFAVLCSGVVGSDKLKGVPFVQEAMATTFGSFGHMFVTICLCVFAFTTLIGNYFYAEINLQYLFNNKAPLFTLITFRICAALIVLLGATLEFALVWNLADVLMGVMVFINMPVLFVLGKHAIRAGQDYIAQRKAGKNPVYIAANNGVTEATDYWK
ncbi:alanine/glycine:cation symporter family protein [Dermabacteraceae bacterium P13128]